MSDTIVDRCDIMRLSFRGNLWQGSGEKRGHWLCRSRELVSGVIQNREQIDCNIQNFAPAWPVAQIPVVDRNILRLAIFEILLDNKVPVKVAINEAVDLAKMFGGDNSSKFVNGVLGSVSALAVNKMLVERKGENANH